MSGHAAPHDQVPSDPTDGALFSCSCCGNSFEFVALNDGLPGEWVSVGDSPEQHLLSALKRSVDNARLARREQTP